jgi:exosortase D (VPLPA-CTERM-specific)
MATTPLAHGDARDTATVPRTVWLTILIAIGGLVAFLYQHTLVVLTSYFNQPEFSHGWLIPLVTLFFLWNRREAILAERTAGSWWGVALGLLAIVLFMVGSLSWIIRLMGISFVILLLAVGYAALGTRSMRRAWLPILFLLAALPLPGLIFVMLSTQLQLISSELGGWMLKAIGIPVFVGGNIIDLGVYKLQVAEACSGLRYLFPLGAFAFLCAWLMRAPLWMRGLVLLSAVPLTIVLNSARIAMTGVFVHYGNVELAEGFMHLFEGWVVFLIALIILFAEMWLLCRLAGNRLGMLDVLDFDRINGPAAVRPATPAPARPGLPLLVLLGLLVATLAAHLALEDRQQYIPPRPGLDTLSLQHGEWAGRRDIIDVETERALGANDYLLADFTDPGGETINLWIAYYDTQVDRAAIHSPKECLPGAGWEYVEIAAVDAPVDPSVAAPFQLNRGIIANGTQRMLIYYWAEMRGRQLTNDVTLKFYNFYDSIVMGRSDGALVRLLTPLAEGETATDGDARMAAFFRALHPHLEPHLGY